MKFGRIVLSLQANTHRLTSHFQDGAITSFHTETCFHLVIAHTQRLSGAYAAASASS